MTQLTGINVGSYFVSWKSTVDVVNDTANKWCRMTDVLMICRVDTLLCFVYVHLLGSNKYGSEVKCLVLELR